MSQNHKWVGTLEREECSVSQSQVGRNPREGGV